MSQFNYAAYFSRFRDIERLVLHPEEVTWTETFIPPSKPVDVLLYLGCNVLITGHLAAEVVDVFKRLPVAFEAVGGLQFCCGIAHHRQGDLEAGARLSRATVEKFLAYGAQTLVMWCPSCMLHFDEVILPRVAPDLPMRVTHATAFLAEHVSALRFERRVDARVALHVHTGRAQQEDDARAARRLLMAVPGVEFCSTVGLPELGYHCTTPPTADARRRFVRYRGELLSRARELGADTLVTIYHSCHREWCEAETPALPIRHYISLVAEALGCPREDRYKAMRRASVDDVVEMSRPRWQAHGWDETRAREVAARYFGGERLDPPADNG